MRDAGKIGEMDVWQIRCGQIVEASGDGGSDTQCDYDLYRREFIVYHRSWYVCVCLLQNIVQESCRAVRGGKVVRKLSGQNKIGSCQDEKRDGTEEGLSYLQLSVLPAEDKDTQRARYGGDQMPEVPDGVSKEELVRKNGTQELQALCLRRMERVW